MSDEQADQIPADDSGATGPMPGRVVLEYSPRPRFWKRKWFFRAVLGVMLAGLGLAGWKYGPPWWRQWRYLRAQSACLEHRLPEDRIVYETGPRVAQLLEQKELYRPVRRRPGWRFFPDRPLGWSPSANYLFDAFDRVNEKQVLPNDWYDALLFCHERTTAGGTRRLVTVDICYATVGTMRDFDRFALPVHASCWNAADWKAGSRVARESSADTFFPNEYNLRRDESVRIFAGQADPSDASHFTIKAETRGKRWQLDGWLRDPPWARGPQSLRNGPWIEMKARVVKDAGGGR